MNIKCTYRNSSGKQFSLSSNGDSQDEHIRLSFSEEGGRIQLSLAAQSPVILTSLSAEMDFSLSKSDKILANGFQSWTDTREFSSSDKIKNMSLLAKLLNPRFQLKQYGDYTFFPHSSGKGEIYGFAFAAARRGNSYTLFASENEDLAHTVIHFSFKKQKVRFICDCEGMTIEGSSLLLNISRMTGSQKDITSYFKKTYGEGNTDPKIGWTSWYNYYQDISDEIILSNLEEFKNYFPKKSTFQIDDGFQTAVGDWLSLDGKKFPNGLAPIVEKIHSYGYEAGLWLAPFSAQSDSQLVKDHPEWIVRDSKNKPVSGGINWKGFYALDIYNEEFREYLKEVFDTVLGSWNFDMVKLDFLYCAAIIPRHGKSRGQIMAEGMDFLRELVGNKKILGCGVPLAQAFKRVDYCRIGCDVGLDWNGKYYEKLLHRERVSTYNSLKDTVYRRFLDGNVFLNDPDVFLLRDDNISLSKTQRITLFLINSIFGSLVFTSDNFTNYTPWQKDLLKNLTFFHSASVDFVTEDDELISFTFTADKKRYRGAANLSSVAKALPEGCVRELDIYSCKPKEEKGETSLFPFETRIFLQA